MTLSLDDVRNKRFRMARKSGYEVLEVDEFVDEVEESFAQLIEENQNLKKQVEALKGSPAAAQTASQPTVSQPAPPAAAPVAETKSAPEAAPAPSTPTATDAIVVTTSKEASTAVVRLVEMATDQAERLVEEANADATRIREEATRGAEQVTTEARSRAERLENEARVNAEQLSADARSRAEKLDRDIDAKRTEMFGDLEKQRDELTQTVEALRGFEAAYRSNLTGHLRSQIETLESGHAEPAEVPEVLRRTDGGSGTPAAAPATERADGDDSPAATTSNTPRLDALLGDQH